MHGFESEGPPGRWRTMTREDERDRTLSCRMKEVKDGGIRFQLCMLCSASGGAGTLYMHYII